MTPVLFALAAAGGAVARHLVALTGPSWRSLLIVNTLGAAILGRLAASDVSHETSLIVGVGLCGALTTFSSFALEVRALGRRGPAYAALTLASACVAAALAAGL